MSTLSVPLTPRLEEFINRMVGQGYAENKAQVVRKAIRKLEEDEAVASLLQAEQEVSEGKILRGNLDDLIRNIK